MFKKIVLSMICGSIMVAGSNIASASDRHDNNDRRDWAEKRMDHKGDRIHRRFDHGAQRTHRNGHHRQIYHLDRHGTSRFNKHFQRHQHDQQCDQRRRHDKGYNKHAYRYAPMDRHSYRNRGHHSYKRSHTNGGAHVRGFSDNVSIWLRF